MARVNVQIPEDLYQRVKACGIPVSLTCQRALLAAVTIREAPTNRQQVLTELLDLIATGRERLGRLEMLLTAGGLDEQGHDLPSR
jgi:Post-segregation antitoxin CcdA